MFPWVAFLCILWTGSALFADDNLKKIEERMINGPAPADVVEYAYRAGTRIAAARAGWRESLEQTRVTGVYPDPRLSATYYPGSVPGDLFAKKYELMLSQEIPFPGKLGAAGDAAKIEARSGRINLDRAVRDTVTAVRASYHELNYIRTARRIAEQNRKLVDELRGLSETAYAKERGTLIDVLKAQSQSAQTGYNVLLLGELEETETARLNALLDREPGAVIGPLADDPPRPVVYSLGELYALAEKNREEIQLARAERERARVEETIAGYETYPDFMLGLSYESFQPEDLSASREDMVGLQFGFSLPLWLDKSAGRRAAARSVSRKAEAMTRTEINETRVLVRETLFQLRNAERLMTLYGDSLIPQAHRSLETAETWARQGTGSLSDYLEIQSVWYNFQLAMARARADYAVYLARLEGLCGQDLTRREEAKGDLTAPGSGEAAP
ncbi:MAG: TolC family protein [Thermodesulfobacteriota bacterium]